MSREPFTISSTKHEHHAKSVQTLPAQEQSSVALHAGYPPQHDVFVSKTTICTATADAKRLPFLPTELRQEIIYRSLEACRPTNVAAPLRIATSDIPDLHRRLKIVLALPQHIQRNQHIAAASQTATPLTSAPSTPAAASSTATPGPSATHICRHCYPIRQPVPLRHELPPTTLSTPHELRDMVGLLHLAVGTKSPLLLQLLHPVRKLQFTLFSAVNELRKLQDQMLDTAMLWPEHMSICAVPCMCPIPLICSYRAGADAFEPDDGSVGMCLLGKGEEEKTVWVAGCQKAWWRRLSAHRHEIMEALKVLKWYETVWEMAGKGELPEHDYWGRPVIRPASGKV